MVNAEFTEELRIFLLNSGYRWLKSTGDVVRNKEEQDDLVDFYLQPLHSIANYKDDDISLHGITLMDEMDAVDMAKGVDLVRFLIELPEDLYFDYLGNINSQSFTD